MLDQARYYVGTVMACPILVVELGETLDDSMVVPIVASFWIVDLV